MFVCVYERERARECREREYGEERDANMMATEPEREREMIETYILPGSHVSEKNDIVCSLVLLILSLLVG